MTTISASFDRDDPPILGANPFVGLTRGQNAAALARVAQRAAVEPGAALATELGALGDLVRVAVGRSDVEPAKGDRRFAGRAWRENPVFRRLLQACLVEQRAAYRLVDEVELDGTSRDRAHFAMSLLIEAAAPTNNLLTNLPSQVPRRRVDVVLLEVLDELVAADTVGQSRVDQEPHAAFPF
jgi:Poly-beta-hydroxybutyrate polymerase (PhaC) N-terminus